MTHFAFVCAVKARGTQHCNFCIYEQKIRLFEFVIRRGAVEGQECGVTSLGDWYPTIRFHSQRSKSYVMGNSTLQTRPLRLLEMSVTNCPENRRHIPEE
jgi:hypothetical protein